MKGKDKERLQKVGDQIKKVRKAKKLSQRKVAARCDVDYSKIGKIERNEENLLVTTLIELAEGLGVPPKELLDVDFSSAD